MLHSLLFTVLLLPITQGEIKWDFAEACYGCVYETSGVGYMNHPHDCNKYFICVRDTRQVFVKACVSGLYWSSNTLTCDWPRNVECNNTSPIATTTDDLCSTRNATEDKRAYLEWSDESWRTRKCEEGQIYDSDSCQCVDDPCYGKRQYTYNSRYYQQLIHGVWKTRPCALGTAFNPESCNCDIHVPTSYTGCRPVIFLTLISLFNGLKDISGNNRYIENDGVYFNTYTAYWNGSSSLSVPYFTNGFIGDKLTIFFFFRREDRQTRVLLSNSVCEEVEASVLIYLTPDRICFKLRNEAGVTVSVCLSCKTVNVWTYVSVCVQDGKLVVMTPFGSKSHIFKGNIATTHCPLSIGKGVEYNNFKGRMAFLKVYADCKPYVVRLLLKYAFEIAAKRNPENMPNPQNSTSALQP